MTLMKKIITLFAVASMVVAAVSCAKEIANSDVENETYTYTFTLGNAEANADTRAVFDETEGVIKYEVDDQVGMYHTANGEAFGSVYGKVTAVDASTGVATLEYQSNTPLAVNDILYAYAPNAYSVNSGLTVKTLTLSIPSNQTQVGAAFDSDAMPRVSVPLTVTEAVAKGEDVGILQMYNLGTLVKFNIYTDNSEYAEEDIVTVTYTSTSGNIAGSFTNYDLTGVSASSPINLGEGTDATIVTTVSGLTGVAASKTAGTSVVYMVVKPGTYSGTLSIHTDCAKYDFALDNKEFVRNHLKVFNVNLASSNCTRTEEKPIIPVSKTISAILKEMGKDGVDPGTAVNPLTFDEVVTIKTTGTGYSANVYGTYPDQDWRIYANGNGNVIISVAEGYELKSVRLTYTEHSNPTFSGPDSDVVDTSVDGKKSVTYNVTNAGHIRISAFQVAYDTETVEPASHDITLAGVTDGKIYLGKNENAEASFSVTSNYAWTATTTYEDGLTDSFAVDPESGNLQDAENNTTEINLLAMQTNTSDARKLGSISIENGGDAATVVEVWQSSGNVVITEGASWSYTFTEKVYTSTGEQTLNGQSWTMTGTGDGYFAYDATKGQQFGSGAKPYSNLSLTSNFGETYGINKVVINTSGASSIVGTVSVSVGGTALTSDGQASVELTASATDYVFTSDELLAGDIVISYAQTSSKAFYIKSIDINPSVRVLTMSDISCSNKTSSTLTFSWDAVDGAAGYQVSIDGGSTYGSTIQTTSYTWEGLSPETSYTIYVKAIGNGMTTSDSVAKSASATTNANTGTQDYTVTWNASIGSLGSEPGTGTISTGSFNWTYNRTLSSGVSYTGTSLNNGYLQIGKNGGVENITFSTSSIPGTIKSVSIDCASYQGKHNVEITVGGNSYLAKTGVPTWSSNNGGVKTGEGTSSGDIVINITDGTRALYIKSITVVYNK